MMNAFFGTRFHIVTGYSGGNDINLAMERGEVEARTNSWQSWKVNRAAWLREGKIAIIAYGGHRSNELRDVPMIEDIAVSDEDRQVLRLLTLGPTLGRPFAAPPGVPTERVAALAGGFRGDRARSGIAGGGCQCRHGARAARRRGHSGAGRECAKDAKDDRRAGEGLSAIGKTYGG